MRLATVDIGTNSTRILIADCVGESISVLDSRLITTRIGEKMGTDKILREEPVSRTVEALALYKDLCNKLNVERIIVTATSAVRDAKNKDFFLALVKEKVSWDVQILTGKEEALLSYRGAIGGISKELYKPVVLDIGGGSTEFIWDSQETECVSIDAGAVRMTEGKHSEEEIYSLLKPALMILSEYEPTTLIGVGGTVTTLAAIDLKLSVYDINKTHGYKLPTENVKKILELLKSLPLRERKLIPGLQPERADVIIAGVTILVIILDTLKLSSCMVSETDILYGMMYKEASIC